MSDPKPKAKRPRKTPRWSFSLGGLVAVALGLPLVVCGLLVLAGAGVADPEDVTLQRAFRLAGIFAGFPLFLSGGGVARLVAHRLTERGWTHLWKPIALGAGAMAAAGIGAEVLAAVPIGGMPEVPVRWLLVAAVGIGAGAITGAAIGVLTALRVKRMPAETPEVTPPAAEEAPAT